MTDLDKGFWVKCANCLHCWIAAFYPGEAVRFSKVARANSKLCPKCGSKKVVVAKQDNGVLTEAANTA